MPKLIVCAGEASGDLIGARALSRFLVRKEKVVFGIGGPNLRAVGVNTWFDSSELSVRGYVETLKQLPRILAIRRRFINQLIRERPELYLGIDAPDFNLGVARQVRKTRVTTVQLVSPAIWAWRASRLSEIIQSIDHMLCIFPFEPDLYASTRVKSIFIGHPLASSIPFRPNPEGNRSLLGLKSALPILAILPGSRNSEIHALSEVFLEVARQLSNDFQCVIPAATFDIERRIRAAKNWPSAEESGVKLFGPTAEGPPISHLVMGASDIGLVASGTAALEMALFGRPHLIAYRVPWVTFKIMKAQSHSRYIGLPNIILDEPVVAECIQEECNVTNLVARLRKLYSDEVHFRRTIEHFSTLHSLLSRDTPAIVANYLELLV